MTTTKKKARQRRLKKAVNLKRNNKEKPRFVLLYDAGTGWRKAPGREHEFYTRAEYKQFGDEMEQIRQEDDRDIYEGRVFDRLTQLVVFNIAPHKAGQSTEEQS